MGKLNITSEVLDKLGFTEYWDEHGTWGGRTLVFSDGTQFRIMEQCEMDDDSEGYSRNGSYVANHWSFEGWFAIPKADGEHELFFLHEMYECVKKYYPNCLVEFVEKCKAVKMGGYIELHLQSKTLPTWHCGENSHLAGEQCTCE